MQLSMFEFNCHPLNKLVHDVQLIDYQHMPDANIMVINNYVNALSIGTAIGFVLYILLGFILSKVFANGKIGHWF